MSLALRKHGDPGRVGHENKVTLNDILKKLTGNKVVRAPKTGDEEPDKGPAINPGDPKIPTVPKTEVTQTQPERKRYFHTITYRKGDQQWREIIETDADGNILSEGTPELVPSPQPNRQPPAALEPTGPKQEK